MKSTIYALKGMGIASFLFPSLLLAEQSMASDKPKNELMPGYNASCRTAVDRKCDLFIDASFIYWQPIQDNMQLGVVSNNSAALDLVHGHEVLLSGNFRPGFQVGLGMNFDYDQWDSYLEYTWYEAKEKAHVSLDPASTTKFLLPAWQIPDFLNPQYSSGSEKWKLTMNLLDWDLARGYNVGTKLCFHPFIGFRAAWIKQSVHVDYVNEDPADESVWPSTYIHDSSSSWGVGPRLGIGMNWNLGAGFRLIGDGEWDILYTQYDLKSSQISDTTASNQYIVNTKNVDCLRTHANLDLGLGWGTYFFNKKYHIDFLADYCFQVFFDQNMFRSTVSAQAIGKSILPNGNLYIQGLTLKARFDF